MNNQLHFGLLLLLLASCRVVWIGYQARFKKRSDVLFKFSPEHYSDHIAAVLIYGLNLFLIGLCGILVALVVYALPQFAKTALYFYAVFAFICGGYFMYRGKQHEKN